MVQELPARPSTDLISTQLSTRELTFQPGGSLAAFDITVTNNSDQFATFQVEVLAAGTETSPTYRWYALSPEVCTKKPPGDSTRFTVQIFNTPRPGYIGLIKLTVRVFSLELREADSRQVLNLIVQGNGMTPPQLDLPTQAFTGYPGDRIKIPFTVQNNNRRLATISLLLTGLEASWFPESNERRLQLAPGEVIKDAFECYIPALTQAPSHLYPFTLEATQPQIEPTRTSGTLTVLPQGFVTFQSSPQSQQIPDHTALQSVIALPGVLQSNSLVPRSTEASSSDDRVHVSPPDVNTASYTLCLENHSNLAQSMSVEASFWQVEGAKATRSTNWLASWKRKRTSYQSLVQRSLTVTPQIADLTLTDPIAFQLTVRQPRPWLGWTRKRWIQVKAITADQRVKVQNETQLLELRLLPRLPFWLQLGGLALLLLLSGAIAWRLLNSGHSASVNSLRFSGLANEVVSGSDDQSLRRWKIERRQLVSQGILAQSNKAVRVVRYRPVNNDAVAIGFENGEMQLVHVLTGDASAPFGDQKDDRVFDLVFANDSRTLFSGHGSGRVVQWSLDAATNVTKVRDRQVGFAINAMALVGEKQRYLAIAGRFNQLVLWDLQTNQLRPASYGTGSERDYILSLSTSAQKPYLLATANNQGTLKTWDLRSCLATGAVCKALDEWTPDQVIHAIAFSADGCYLASAGENGRATLWSLTARGDRQTQSGQTVGQSNKRLTAIDVTRTKDEVLVAAGGDDTHVQFHRVKAENTCR